MSPGVAVAASVFTITAMSVDRWLSISTEPRLRPLGRKQALLLLLVLWCAALLIFIPLLLVSSVRKETIPVISKGIRNISVSCAFFILYEFAFYLYFCLIESNNEGLRLAPPAPLLILLLKVSYIILRRKHRRQEKILLTVRIMNG